MPSQTKENYLKALHFLSEKDEVINLSELSKEMDVSTPTANSMVKKLKDKGWLIYEKYKPLRLTKKGRKEAALIIRKHRLAEMFLVQIMGFGWEQVHEIAEQLEHTESLAFFDRMDELLGYPTVDPHGSPIPNNQGEIAYKQYQALIDVDEGAKVRLCALANSSVDLLHYLNSRSIQLGSELTILKKERFDGSIELKVKGVKKEIHMGSDAAAHLLVEARE